jgi:protein-arginine deiminase
VVLVNNDDDGARGAPDNENNTIEGGNDPDDVSPLAIEVVGIPAPGTRVELIVSDSSRLRIFDSQVTGASELIGPTAGDRHTFLPTTPGRINLGMEALRYAGGGFNGELTVTLGVTDPVSGTSRSSSTVVRVSPWIVANHLDAAEAVFVVDARSSNSRFRTDLDSLVRAAGCRLVQVVRPTDIWMQDCMEFGYATNGAVSLRTVFRAARDRPLVSFPRTLLRADQGYMEQGTLTPFFTNDSTGNLEATPPVTSTAGKRYPQGRIYYCPGTALEPIDPEVRDFLRSQFVQDPIELDLTWLTVGHVDEVISFVPASNDKGFVLLLASPRVGYSTLDAANASNPTAHVLTGRQFPTATAGSFGVEQRVSSFLSLRDDFHPDLRAFNPTYTARSLRQYNLDRQANIDAVRARLLPELGLTTAHVIEIPAVLMPNPGVPSLADALIAGMVNMLVINGHCIIPKPFGPVVAGIDLFEKDVRDKLAPLGLVVSFLDCWDEYHVNLGEVHCATNTLRMAPNPPWWEFQP